MDAAQAALDAGDPGRARALMEQAAATGHPEAMNGFATYVNLGVGAPPDPERASALLEEAAAAGSIAAKLNLGMQLIDSTEATEQRLAVAILEELYANPPRHAGRETVRGLAAGGLARAYLFGVAVEEDVPRGVALLELAEAADAADPGTLFLLGRCYESGWGGREPDATRSTGYFRRAAELDHPGSQWKLGMALLNGSGVRADAEEAYVWVRRAAEAGFTPAEISTAVMLALGQGVEGDPAESRRWYQRAAQKNSAHAMRGLGFMLLEGDGGPRDAARGYAYLRLAADVGEPVAVQLMAQLDERLLSDEERRASEEFVERWLADHGPPTLD